ncbi:MAG: AMP-binding protein [Polyangiaceae bacterium]
MSNGTSPTGAPYGSSSHPALLDAENVATAGSSARPLDPTQLFDGVRLLILGGTGFLGKIFWILLLHRYPNVGRIYLLVRKGKGRTPEQRFWDEIAASEALKPLREQHGDAFETFLRERIVPIDGDVGREVCGIDKGLLRELRGTIDAVVNVAGVVDFNPPLDEALDANAFGAQNLIELCRALGDAPLFHTSTCYVVGNRTGEIDEEVPMAHPFPRADELGRELWDPEREVKDCLDIIAQAHHRCDDAFRQSEFLERAKKNLLARQEPTEGGPLEAELANVRRRWVSDRLVEAGKERATHWGWPNVYTYTKSIGEQLISKSGLVHTIGRPACCETTIEFPFPGWNEGIGTSAPIIFMVMKGQHQMVARDILLDFIPADTVCVGMILSLAELLEESHAPVYQYGLSDSNPCTSRRYGELIGLYKRKYFQRRGKGNPFLNFLNSHIEISVVSKERFAAVGPRRFAAIARQVSSVLKALPGPAASVGRASAGALESFAKQEERIADVFGLFMPFTYDQKGPFSCANTRAAYARLSEEDKAKLPWTPEKLDWARYFMEQHMPAMENRIIPWMEERYGKKEPKALRSHHTLVTLVDQMAERHTHALAFQYMEDTGFSRVTYNDVAQKSKNVAARLVQAGLRKGDRVYLSAENSPAWPIVYFGILRAGGSAVPVDANMEAMPAANILRESGATFAAWDAHVEKKAGTELRKATSKLRDFTLEYLMSDVVGDAAAYTPFTEVELLPEDVASVIFTSGTTGVPKGVLLSHANFTSIIAALAPLFPIGERDRVLSVLPLHHTFEFTCGLLLPFSRGTRILYLDELTGERVSRGMREGRITAMVGVPAVWQLLERRILSQVEARGPISRAFFDLGGELNRFLVKNAGLDIGKLLFGTVHDALGGHVRTLISGGAALPPETQKLFQGLGLKLAEGYGLTEASPVLTVAKPDTGRGHVGKPIPGVSIRIADPDQNGVGEVLAKGPNVMVGYTSPAATAQVLEDGWLRTGDLGKLDRKGNLVISGRSKDVVVTASGENIYPDDVERLLGKVPHIDELAIVGVTTESGVERLACIAVPETDDSVSRAERMTRAEASLRAAISKLPYGQQPGITHFYDAKLPRTATRKVKRNEARALLERMLAAKNRAEGHEEGRGTESPVRRAISSVKGKKLSDIHATSTMQGDLGFDSLSLTELLATLETDFGTIDPQALMACVTVQDVERLVHVTSTPSIVPAKRASRYAIQGRRDDSKEDDVRILPEFVQERGKQLIGKIQDAFYGGMMKPRVIGQANIPHNRNVIVVANHTSHLDMGFVRHALGPFGEDLVSLAASDYFFERESWKRTFFENFSNLKAIDRKGGLRASERQAAEVITSGKNMLIFPEGTRSVNGEVQEFKSLIGHLSLYYGVDILPVYIGGAFEAMPKGSKLPKKRELVARIGPPLCVSDLRRLTAGMKMADATRETARLAREAVLALKEGSSLSIASLGSREEVKERDETNPLTRLFSELERKFDKTAVKNPLSFYFTLGGDDLSKWTVSVKPGHCEIKQGKPAGGTADCVLKTNPEIFRRIVQEAYTPGPAEFLSGAIKSNDVGLLVEFQRVFRLDQVTS